MSRWSDDRWTVKTWGQGTEKHWNFGHKEWCWPWCTDIPHHFPYQENKSRVVCSSVPDTIFVCSLFQNMYCVTLPLVVVKLISILAQLQHFHTRVRHVSGVWHVARCCWILLHHNLLCIAHVDSGGGCICSDIVLLSCLWCFSPIFTTYRVITSYCTTLQGD